jgi:hypothetical protein
MVGNLQFIKSVTISSATNLDVTDVFSSNYNVYYVTAVQTYLDSTSSDGNNRQQDLRFFDSGGTIISASEYDYANLELKSNTSFAEDRHTGQTLIENIMQIDSSSKSAGTSFYIHNPFDSSSYTFIQTQSAGSTNTPYLRGYKLIGVHKSAEQLSGFRLFNANSASWNGKVSVYGVK